MIDFLATEAHFRDHLAPIWEALPAADRGAFRTDPDDLGPSDSRHVLVASYGDHKRARAIGYERIARIEHGAGQSYGGDPRTASIANYAGGKDADDVTLFLVPGAHPAMRWATRYPTARVEVVGTPRLDTLPAREGSGPTTVALSFHFNAFLGCPEGDGAFRWYRNGLRSLTRRLHVIGHAHPRHAQRMRPWFDRAGIEFVPTFDEVCRRADVYAVDNSSTLFEFAATGRPVVALDSPLYRRDAHHGLRFWDAAHVGQRATAATLEPVLERALVAGGDEVHAREHALSLVYGHRTGAAARAATALQEWAGG